MSPSILLVALLTLAAAPAGPARGDAARRAEAAFEAGDYDAAAEAAAEAYVAEGDPIYLYVQAQAERFGGRCGPAIEHYRQFITAVPRGDAADAARDNIAECEAVLAQAQPAPDPIDPLPPVDSTAPVQTEPEVGTRDARERGGHWARDPLGGALVGAGVVVLGIGGGLSGKAHADERSAMKATDVITYGEQIDRAYTLSRVGLSVMIVGGALVVGGVVRWAVLANRSKRGNTIARFAQMLLPAPGGVVLRF
jgi:hypothetical protein